MNNMLQMKDVGTIKRFTEISKGGELVTVDSVFWTILWLLICFPVLVLVIPYYVLTRKGTTIKAEHNDGTIKVYEKVSQPVMMALHNTVRF